MPPSLARVKPVQQKRSEEMRDRLLEALGSAVDAGEIEAMSVHDIATRAGASVERLLWPFRRQGRRPRRASRRAARGFRG
ncbi:MAG: hypothetical protein R3C55_00455 [Parvularculaceae bacterium]